MTNTVHFLPDDARKVFATTVTLTIEATVFVLARNHNHAVGVVNAIDLQDYFTFGPHYVRTDSEGLLKFNDVHTDRLNVTIVDLTQLTTEEYPPNTHPDFIDVKR